MATASSATGGDGTFEDVTDVAGIARIGRGYGFGVTVGDYDNDGRPDLFVTRFGSYAPASQPGRRHVRGRHRARRVWAATATGRPRRHSPTSTATATSTCMSATTWPGTPRIPRSAAHPESPTDTSPACRSAFPALPDHLFRNDGGRFVDVTAAAGIVDRDGRGLGRRRRRPRRRRPHRPVRGQRHDGQSPVPQPGRPAVRGDRPPRPGSPATPRGATRPAWASPAATSTATAGPTWPSPTSSANRRRSTATWGDGMFADATTAVGLKAPSRFLLGFGITFLDVDNDGRLDLATANGHIHDLRPKIPYAMPAQLLTGDRRRPIDRRHRPGRRTLDGPADRPRPGRAPTSTTTAASTCCSSRRTRRWPTSTTGPSTPAISSPCGWRGPRRTATPSAQGSP